ncbi:hypothetical protein SLEP1_g52622 [Rubroshorea leprosula]|uniref:NB-ARC domain-containing protein n=1 Tax=Rubroshorea leprosula TaxID=152421 RepID=A0AAV5M7S4_9ROSI|nr:hypothetical protein SLEP1_g52622 [Rubroshorea leprosula]
MADIATLILEIIKCMATPTCRCVDYHRKFKQDVEDLKSKVRDLNSRKKDVETQLDAEVCLQKQVKQQVEDWLQDVQRINVEIQKVERRVDNASFLSRARLGKLVREKINAVDTILQRGRFPEGLVVNKPATALPFRVENLEGEVSVKEKIWGYLTGNEVQMIGVCGIGGVGKTTIMKHIHDELLLESRFDKVIWVTVSHPLNVRRLQDEIAKRMNESLLENEDKQRRALELKEMMGRVKYALILDDVWQGFMLEDVGILRPTVENGCKIVITSRKVDVCKSLGCEIVKVSPLSKEESLNLFLDKVGRDILQVPELEGFWKAMVEECAGLPLAVVVIARSMKGVTNVREWRHALNELCRRIRATAEGSEDEIFERLKFSYDRLQDSNIQNCFLSCSLYAEDYEIRRDDLVEQWIDEGLIEESSRQVMLDNGHFILNKLENNCLLENGHSKDTIKMHDVVRDMALRIGSQFMVKACMRLTDIPDEHDWTENVEKVSLMENAISDIPINMCPICPNLTTLMLQGNWELTQIPGCFFANMRGLKCLNLSETSIESLPHSICNLESLTTLLLRDCRQLKHVPCLAKLKALKKLDMFKAGIDVVPEGIDMLVNLQYLDLRCPELVELSTQILGNLSHLQHLTVYSKSTTLKIKGKEVRGLKKLETFQAQLYDLQHFNNYVKSNHFKRLSNYRLVVGQVQIGFGSIINFSKEISLGECEIGGEDSVLLPDDVEDLWIYRCRKFRSLSDIYSLQKTTELRNCFVTECEEIGCVVDMVTSSSSFINNLESLWLEKLPNLSVVANVEGVKATSPHIFSNLQYFVMKECSSMKRLFSLELLQGLQNLEGIRVCNCQQMEEIIGWEGEEENHTADATTTTTFNLPKLRVLSLQNLSEFKRNCPTRGVMVCDSLGWLTIKECPELRRIPLLQGLQNLEGITVWNCQQMEEIIGWEGEEENHTADATTTTTFTLPKLRKLNLQNLPELKRICSTKGVMVCDSLQHLQIEKCPKLRRIPLVGNVRPSPPAALKQIQIEPKELWESLEWDDPNAKNVLQPFMGCPFIEDRNSRVWFPIIQMKNS